MGYFLIIIGIISIVAGVIVLTRNSTPTVSVTIHNGSTKGINEENVSENKQNIIADTVEVERVVEKVVEKEGSLQPKGSEAKDAAVATDSNKAKGDAFEDFVVNLLADWRLKLLDRTQDHKSEAGVVAESSKNPDLHIEQKRGKNDIDYYIECKYRSRWDDGKVSFEEWQLKRYRQFQSSSKRKVLIALGVGGIPSSPSTLRIVPIDSIKNNSIREIDTQFAVQPTSNSFIEYMNSYFTKVFKTSREGKK